MDLALSSQDPAGASLDHVLPKAYGGGYALGNLRLAHRRCNETRGYLYGLIRHGACLVGDLPPLAQLAVLCILGAEGVRLARTDA